MKRTSKMSPEEYRVWKIEELHKSGIPCYDLKVGERLISWPDPLYNVQERYLVNENDVRSLAPELPSFNEIKNPAYIGCIVLNKGKLRIEVTVYDNDKTFEENRERYYREFEVDPSLYELIEL